MEQEKQELLHKLREFWLGNLDGVLFEQLITPERLLELYRHDPEFKRACDEDEVLDEIVKGLEWLEAPKKRALRFFDQFRDFCLGKDVDFVGDRNSIKIFYQGNPEFKEACDNDPVVREVIMRWFEEDQEHM